MATDLERLVVSLSADIKSYERALAKASGLTTSQLRKMETQAAKSMGRVEKSFAKAGNAIAGFGKGLVIGGIFAAVAGLEQLVAGSISSAAAIGDLSEKIGISSDNLQELQYGAVQANMSFDDLERNLLKFSKSLGEARNGQGELLETLRANGFTDAKIKALSYSDALDVMADLIKNAATEADAMLIATQAFGRSGADMVEFLRNGSDGLKTFATDAQKAGAVIEASLIKSAQAFDDAWSAALLSIKSKLGDLVLSAVPLIQRFDKAVSDAADQLGIALGTIDPASLTNQRSRSPFVAPLTQSGPGKGDGSTKVFNPEQAKRDAEAYTAAQKEKSDAIKRLIDFSIEGQHRAAEAAEEAAQRQLELDQELYDSKMALAGAAMDAFDAIIIGGEKASDVIKDLASSLLKAAVQASLFGSGPFASLFGTSGSGGILGGLFGKPTGKASGGHVNAGQPYMVGEKRPELFVPSQSGSIVPRIGGGAGSAKFIVNNYAGVDVKTRQDGQGNMIADLRRVVVDTIAGGYTNKAMRGQYGLNPNKARR